MTTELNAAIEVFVAAITRVKSQYHPYLCDRLGDLYVMHDEPARKNPRKTEVVTTGKDPESVVQSIRRAALGWHFLCDIHTSQDDSERIRSEYKRLGYRALATEWMFLHDLLEIPAFQACPPVRLVETQAHANAIPQLASHKLKLMPDSRDFRIWDDARDYGFVRSLDVGNSCWVQGLYVHADARRRGYGRALMSSLLQTDATLGRDRSILLASSSGATLYPHLGYRQIGILQMFCPATRS